MTLRSFFDVAPTWLKIRQSPLLEKEGRLHKFEPESIHVVHKALNLKQRSNQRELMDDLTAGGPEIQQTLKELSMVNTVLGGYATSRLGLWKLLRQTVGNGKTYTVADLGCGGGDTLRNLTRWGREKGLKLQFIGLDANPNIVQYARAKSMSFPEISYEVMDVLSPEFLERRYDVIHSAMFCHHFTDDQLLGMMRTWGEISSVGWVINDLHRHPFAFHSIDFLTKLFSRSAMVRHDASVSVARAFQREDWQKLLKNADIGPASITWLWAFRWLVVGKRVR